MAQRERLAPLIRKRAVAGRRRGGVGARDRPAQHLPRDAPRDAPGDRPVGGHEHVIVDGNRIVGLRGPGRAVHGNVVDGDAKVYSIACASVVAKVVRDRMMIKLAARYPGYGWEHNQGYATRDHRDAIRAMGLTPSIGARSWRSSGRWRATSSTSTSWRIRRRRPDPRTARAGARAGHGRRRGVRPGRPGVARGIAGLTAGPNGRRQLPDEVADTSRMRPRRLSAWMRHRPTDPDRGPAGRATPPKRWSWTGWSRPAGPSWPGTSMSAATNSISWRSTRVRPAALVIVEVRWRRSRASGCRRRRSITESGRDSRQAAYGLLDRGSMPDGSAIPRLPLRFDRRGGRAERTKEETPHAAPSRRRSEGDGVDPSATAIGSAEYARGASQSLDQAPMVSRDRVERRISASGEVGLESPGSEAPAPSSSAARRRSPPARSGWRRCRTPGSGRPGRQDPVLHSAAARNPRATPTSNRPPGRTPSGAHTRPSRSGWCRANEARSASSQGSAEERTEQEVAHRAVRLDAAAARGRGPLRPPDPPLEPQDAPVHLRRAQRDPHHRSRPDRPAPGRRPRGRPRDRRPRRPGPVRRDQEAGPGADRRRGDPRQHAVRPEALARRHADELHDHQEAHRPARAARGAPGGRRLRAHDQEGSRQADRGDGQAPGHRRRHAQDEAPAGRWSSSSTRTASASP